MKIWLVFNSVSIFVVATLLYLTIRQIGLILGRLGPIGARSSEHVGPRIGENLSAFLDKIETPEKTRMPTLYIFGSSSCGICTKIKSFANSLAKYWAPKAHVVLVYDPLPANSRRKEDESGLVPIVRSNIRTNVGVHSVPFGVIVDSDGVVIGKGLVNEMSHIESLLELTQTQK